MMEEHGGSKSTAWRRGWIVFVVLAVLTVLEFVVSNALSSPLPYLAIIALAKAALIIASFMRLGDLRVVWREEVGR
jgi:heme/copper-type cytochrome/quinol oxidase subunit 4